jgi:hypothetical protein
MCTVEKIQLRIWWKAWGELVLRFLALAGSLGSLIGLLAPFLPSLKPLPWWAITLIVRAHPKRPYKHRSNRVKVKRREGLILLDVRRKGWRCQNRGNEGNPKRPVWGAGM